jgi:hypothetical protein
MSSKRVLVTVPISMLLHAHFSVRAVASAAFICLALTQNYDLSRYTIPQIQCKRFNHNCSEVCSSLQQQAAAAGAAPAAFAVAAAAAAPTASKAADFLSSSDEFRAMKP